ncbi:MAG: hypothetical protein WD011_03725, partial [Nitriliruptoraceae bacterium]
MTELPAGDYTLAVAAAGTTDAVLELDATLTAGTSVTVAAYLDPNGVPQLRAFVNENDASGIQPFHLANFGAVDILAGGDVALAGVTNGQTARIDVEGGTTVSNVGIAAAGSGTSAIALGDVTVPAGTLVLAYAIGPDEGCRAADRRGRHHRHRRARERGAVRYRWRRGFHVDVLDGVARTCRRCTDRDRRCRPAPARLTTAERGGG